MDFENITSEMIAETFMKIESALKLLKSSDTQGVKLSAFRLSLKNTIFESWLILHPEYIVVDGYLRFEFPYDIAADIEAKVGILGGLVKKQNALASEISVLKQKIYELGEAKNGSRSS